MTTTPHLALPLLAAAQAQKHVTHNEALISLDALVQISVKERGRVAPPDAPGEGAVYLIGPEATGAFATHDGDIALFDQGAWRFFTPRAGWRVYVEAEDCVLIFDGSQWRDLGHYSRLLDRVAKLGVGTTPDDLNRISAKLNAVLFSALTAEEGGTGDLRVVLNKSAIGNVLSQIYQRNYSGRAETGLIGNDDFSLRVSPDGNQWRDALLVDRNTGVASFPSGLANVPGTNLLINSAFRVNQRGFSGSSLAAGSFGVDRWKGGTGGCTIGTTLDGGITLTGTLEQVVEVAYVAPWVGATSLAGATLTFSVQDPSASLSVTIGTKTGAITAGTGRRSATVTLGTSETGNVTVRIQAASSCSFKLPKLETGAYATPWFGDPHEVEELRCRRYYHRLFMSGGTPSILAVPGQRVATNSIDMPYLLPVPMRTNPTIATSGFSWSNASPTGNQIGFYDNAAGAWVTLNGTLSVTSAATPGTSSAIVRLQASTSFTGASGALGYLYLGSTAAIALVAEL